jgi:hypothetical protein
MDTREDGWVTIGQIVVETETGVFQTFGRTTSRVEYPYHPPSGRASFGVSRPFVTDRNICHYMWYGALSGRRA